MSKREFISRVELRIEGLGVREHLTSQINIV